MGRAGNADHCARPVQVEVEVQRNAYGPKETMTDRLQVAEDSSHGLVNEIRKKLRLAPEELEQVLSQTEEGVKREAHEVEERAKEAGAAALSALGTHAPQTKHDEGEEDDEGWMSDQSAGEPSGSGAAARGKSPKSKGTKGSRKRSMRRGVLGQRPQAIQRSQSEDFAARRASTVADEDSSGTPPSGTQTPSEDTRGRSSAMHRSPAGSGTHTPTYVRAAHRRIDSIRSGAPSREMSPARSVRFVEELPSPRVMSPSSPASPAFLSVPGAGAPPSSSQPHSSETETEEDDSPRNQVRFSLPSPGDKANHDHHGKA